MYHHFISVSSNTISYKKKSVDTHTEVFDNIQKNKNNKEISLNIKKIDFITCWYDEFWWVWIAKNVSELVIFIKLLSFIINIYII